jgi:H+/gluconate symporter-like permease
MAKVKHAKPARRTRDSSDEATYKYMTLTTVFFTISLSLSSVLRITDLEVFIWIFLISVIPLAICALKYFWKLLDRSKSSIKKEIFKYESEKKYVNLTIYSLGLSAILISIYDKTNLDVLRWIGLVVCVPALIFTSILFVRYLTRNRRKTDENEKEA